MSSGALAERANSTGPDHVDHALSDVGRHLMFPGSQHRPTVALKCLISMTIALSIPLNLLSPVLRIELRHRVVLGTSVPETPADEDGDPRARDEEVGPAVDAGKRAGIDAVAEPSSVHEAPRRKFGLGVAATVRFHRTSHAARCSPRLQRSQLTIYNRSSIQTSIRATSAN